MCIKNILIILIILGIYLGLSTGCLGLSTESLGLGTRELGTQRSNSEDEKRSLGQSSEARKKNPPRAQNVCALSSKVTVFQGPPTPLTNH
jgi:hypothetical protein